MPIDDVGREDMSCMILNTHFKESNISGFNHFNADHALNNSSDDNIGDNENREDKTALSFSHCKGELLTLNALKQFLKENYSQDDTNNRRPKGAMPILTQVCMSDSQDEVKKSKKKKKVGTICLVNCKYGVIKRIAKHFGMKEVDECDLWNVYWTDLSISVERAKEMKRFQKVNHFPGMSEICRKDLLARNLNRMLKMFPKDYNFFPKTWCIPADLGDVLANAKSHPMRTYIVKPDIGCQGKGIFLTKSLKELRGIGLYDRMICQVYISKPYLVDGFKFDMRVYALITSVDPLRIFVYNDGLARFATSRYKEPGGHNTTNLYMHLTNYAVNKHSRAYVVDEESGSKRRLSTVNEYLMKMNEDVDLLWKSIDDIIIKTIIAAHPVLKHSYHTCFPTHDIMYACFELLGFDILLDYKLKPYILEVNHSPSFHTDAKLDKDIKESLLRDTFSILNLAQCHKKRALEEDKQRAKERLLQSLNPQSKLLESNKTDIIHNTSLDRNHDFSAQVEKWEMNNLGNFRLIYPCNNCDNYKEFFEQNLSSIFQETFASRAREEARKIQREEFERKMREELSLRISEKENKIKEKNHPSEFVHPESPHVIIRRNLPKLKKKIERFLCSFEPTMIEDSEEMERVAAMTQRDYLVRSYGVINHIYIMMKKGGNLRISDIVKYGVFEKNKSKSRSDPSSLINNDNDLEAKSLMKILPKIKDSDARDVSQCGVTSFPIKYTILEPPWQKCMMNNKCAINSHHNFNSRWNNTRVLDSENSFEQQRSNNGKLPGLSVTCNEALMWTRPNLPNPAEWPNKLGAKSTRTFIARHFSNTLKLQDMECRLSTDRELKLNSERQSTL